VRCVVLTERCLSVLAVVRPLWIDAQRRFKNAIGANLEGMLTSLSQISGLPEKVGDKGNA